MTEATRSAAAAAVADVSCAPLSPISFLLRSAAVWQESPAVRFDGATFSYRELLEFTESLAGLLVERGISAGDRVAVMLPNIPEMLAMHFAVTGIGAALVPINVRLGAQEGGYILEHSGARVLVVA